MKQLINIYLTKYFRKSIYDYNLKTIFSCRFIIIKIFKKYNILNLKDIIYDK